MQNVVDSIGESKSVIGIFTVEISNIDCCQLHFFGKTKGHGTMDDPVLQNNIRQVCKLRLHPDPEI
jgi:hypothetical protein